MSNPYAPPDPTKPRPVPPQRPPQQQRPAPSEPPREPAPPLTPEQVRGVTSGVMWFGLLMLATLLATGLEMPWQLLAPVAGVAAFVCGLRTVLRARAVRWRGLLVPMLVGGLALTGLTTSTAVLDLGLNWDAKIALTQCRERAITISAKERCDTIYSQDTDPQERFSNG